MSETFTIRGISTLVNDLRQNLEKQERATLGFLIEALHERGFGVLLLIFAAPMALPIPVPPGINIILASPLLFLTAQQALGRHTIWMPRRLLSKQISRKKMCGMMAAIIPWLEKIEFLLRPRLRWATNDGASCIFGFMGFLMAITVTIPVPMTNTIPSLGIALMALGTITRDGLVTITGALIGTAWVALLTGGVIFFGAEALDMIKEMIKSFI